MSAKILTEHHLEFLPLQGGCTGSSESTLVKIPHCWKSHVMYQITLNSDSQTEPLVDTHVIRTHFMESVKLSLRRDPISNL